ncbi:hypothetical protein NLM33_40450 [Bradyrhizobium sp. CCGUVB1N3]|uniref:hypothetical protein n=1 Tax=Bradyrhizobium sp. CCGUVB1N3 TaxID=2949629 RepID=UPI0020B2FA97|nr:hypothetical protein [Bradyrhizobium sp. CCGUVB1N3]MCP3476487.1 hypothetical protein [Bradyrhizobium sp. CCGUVB1N3]
MKRSIIGAIGLADSISIVASPLRVKLRIAFEVLDRRRQLDRELPACRVQVVKLELRHGVSPSGKELEPSHMPPPVKQFAIRLERRTKTLLPPLSADGPI